MALPAPTIPGGVQAAWSAITYRVNGVVTSAGKTNLAVGWKGTSTLFPGMVAVVTSVSGSNAVFSILVSDGGSAGSDLSSVPNSGNTNTITLTKSAGGGTAGTFTVDVNLQIVAMTITEKGSGYTGAETFTVTVAGSMDPPAGTIVLTTDSGNFSSNPLVPGVNAVDNQENAIKIYANIGGSGGVISDIVKQEGTRRYKVENGDGTGYVNLTTARANAGALTNAEALILAYDSAGNTYFVNKLTAHKATVYQGNGSQFANGSAVSWNFTAGVANVSVKIDNA